MQHLKIAFQSYNICQGLGNNTDTASGLLAGQLAMSRILDISLHDLETELGLSKNLFIRMAFLRVKLQLYSFAFNEIPADGDNNLAVAQTATLKLKAVSDAINIVDIASQHLNSMHNSQQVWPAIVRASVVYATHILLRYNRSVPSEGDSHVKNVICRAWLLLNAWSELEHDSWSRVCDIITYLSRDNEKCDGARTITVKARMAANITIESIWRARSRFGQDVLNERPQDYTATAAAKDLFEFGLDFVTGSEFLEDAFPDIYTSHMTAATSNSVA